MSITRGWTAVKDTRTHGDPAADDVPQFAASRKMNSVMVKWNPDGLRKLGEKPDAKPDIHAKFF